MRSKFWALFALVKTRCENNLKLPAFCGFVKVYRWPAKYCIASQKTYFRGVGKSKGNPWVDFLMVIMASLIARGRITTTTESRNMAAILQITGWQRGMQPWFTVYFFGIGHPCYDQLTPVKTRYPLTSITWPYCGLKLTAHRGHVFFWKWPLTRCCFFHWIAGSCLVNLLKTGQDCSESRSTLTQD